ncbi:ABC transporter ATP-binding protein [Pauljensenia sp. UMB1235]|uniref:ABC transporter ATP-binding protein n=1 Tax=unclassified Pauljensenia TaxID=2908895 RepID=UPI00254CA7C5|nr:MULTISPECIES: ABC transporter ATP-binding protein [unclassified Pauljensenia]MDK6400285.1 ABC transporter ATP-binding protein [Pauljensenia sp. UMB9872]MDK7173546.1 ABC transporter ATP-binding protein [Pauljensenia sp. UMB1235]
MSVLTATNVTKSYGLVRAVDGVSLEVSAGEIVALLGHNGSGKTTLLECIEGLRRPDSGHIRILGREHSYMARVPDRLGVQLQEEQLPSRIKVREALWLYSHIYAVPDAPQDLMEAMDVAPLLDKRFDALSGGQKRRVNLCLAFIGQPELVLLDEPTAGLDPEAQRALVQVLRRHRNEGLAVLMTLHEVDHAAELADRVVVMAHGQIAATGTVSELIASLNVAACAVLTSGTDAGPWQEVGDVQHGPEDTWLVFGDRVALQQAMSTLPGGETASLRPVGLGDVVTRAAQQEVTR